jgi:hypothetical protein
MRRRPFGNACGTRFIMMNRVTWAAGVMSEARSPTLPTANWSLVTRAGGALRVKWPGGNGACR